MQDLADSLRALVQKSREVILSPGSAQTATCGSQGATDEKPLRAFREGQFWRHGDRVRPHRGGHFGRDYRGRQRPRHQLEQQVLQHLDPAQVIEPVETATKAPAQLPGPFCF